MAGTMRRVKASRGRKSVELVESRLIDYVWGGESYVLDLRSDRVYRDWMAVETNKGFTILGAYRSEQAAIA